MRHIAMAALMQMLAWAANAAALAMQADLAATSGDSGSYPNHVDSDKFYYITWEHPSSASVSYY